MDAMEQFTQQYSQYTQKQVVEITCKKCQKETSLLKERAGENVKRNGGFVCRSCRMSEVNPNRVWTERGRQAVAEAASRPRSAETRQKMSESRKKFFQTPAGQEHKLARSRDAALGHSQNKYEKSKLHGWYFSSKNSKHVFFGSSYELRLCWTLDQDELVDTYVTQIGFETPTGRGRCIDCLVTYKDGRKKVIEVKPQDRLEEKNIIEQIQDSADYAAQQGYQFEVITEASLGMTGPQIRSWADQYLLETTGQDWAEVRKVAHRVNAKRHYDTKIATDKVEVDCPFCNEVHSVLAKSHKSNVERNGRYICEREGGHISGSKPKLALRKENLFAAEGKKECVLCKEVKPFNQFGADKSRRDGYSSRCLECRARVAKEKYQQKCWHKKWGHKYILCTPLWSHMKTYAEWAKEQPVNELRGFLSNLFNTGMGRPTQQPQQQITLPVARRIPTAQPVDPNQPPPGTTLARRAQPQTAQPAGAPQPVPGTTLAARPQPQPAAGTPRPQNAQPRPNQSFDWGKWEDGFRQAANAGQPAQKPNTPQGASAQQAVTPPPAPQAAPAPAATAPQQPGKDINPKNPFGAAPFQKPPTPADGSAWTDWLTRNNLPTDYQPGQPTNMRDRAKQGLSYQATKGLDKGYLDSVAKKYQQLQQPTQPFVPPTPNRPHDVNLDQNDNWFRRKQGNQYGKDQGKKDTGGSASYLYQPGA